MRRHLSCDVQSPKRLSVYHDQTQPLIDYYKKQGILVTVDGTKELNEVFRDIVAVLGA